VVWVAPDGTLVEPIKLQRNLRRPPVELYKVTRRGYLIAYCRTLGDLARYVDLASLVLGEP
jgi:hypothetical protein